ncbi:hypothetical protein [Lactobacillus gasseri]|nr:hypothetical protein [Lactobacillus gasseri]
MSNKESQLELKQEKLAKSVLHDKAKNNNDKVIDGWRRVIRGE